MGVNKEKRGHGQKMTRKMELAALALVTEPTIKDAADHVKVSESTLLRWMKREDFQAVHLEMKHKAVGQAIALMQKSTTKAVETLISVLDDEDTPATVRVAAARIFIDRALKSVELENIQTRLDELERRANL